MKQKGASPLTQVRLDNEIYYRIADVDHMRPFFMSIVSDANHWLFMGSNGGLTAGRKDAENALFPYYTDDKIIESAETTGVKTIFRIQKDGRRQLWEPFSLRNSDQYDVQRNLFKNVYGNKILFEEVNRDLNLTFQYQWCTSNTYGFIKTSRLLNDGSAAINISVVDGIQNMLPYGVGNAMQNKTSNLVDAYKRNELVKESGIGIFALSSIIVDKPEPSEALKATIAWTLGLKNTKYLLSVLQLEAFRKGLPVTQELDIKGEKCAYFIQSEFELPPRDKKEWLIMAEINQSAAQIIATSKAITTDKHLAFRIKEDIEKGTQQLIQLNAAADGLQFTADPVRDTRHFANTMFNIMRGGIFDYNYQIEKSDFKNYLASANQQVYEHHKQSIDKLSNQFTLTTLKDLAQSSGSDDLKRLCVEYLPLKFSRRHGDPSRPWNQFTINTQNEDGSKVLDYAGNWRDIFQNWEALVYSYPRFIEGMIFKFLNATTFDGYNPYRITRNGMDWERIEADDPWSYIGYWGDHQIIYLLKLLEFSENVAPGSWVTYFNEPVFTYANVPYKIKPYADILRNPKDTIDFDHKLDKEIQKRWLRIGSDSALLPCKNGNIHHVNFVEKILATVLAKLSNFIPEGGIWMNTQRPEWNDANNALVGNGLSMVTLYYLRRFLAFFKDVLSKSAAKEVQISEELVNFFTSCRATLESNQQVLHGAIDNRNRKKILDGLGKAASDYRVLIYTHGFSSQTKRVTISEIIAFTNLSLRYVEHTINANRRSDNLYHAYNLMTVENGEEISIACLSEMLEGQVAVLCSGYLTSKQVLETLNALKASSLFRADQYSYLLYPNKELPGFLQKNIIPESDVTKSVLLNALIKSNNTQIIEHDAIRRFHFNSNFRNASDLLNALEALDKTQYPVSTAQQQEVLALFEKVFNHKAFTGRSGTFFGYEGLGSIYWHMVSKLQLAVQDCCLKAIAENQTEEIISKLVEHYYEISEGIGVHKSPEQYGAFPTDPYSHTPANKGAQQPGMTGQVKEDMLSRWGELGVFVKQGCLVFLPTMLRKSEFLSEAKVVNYVSVTGQQVELSLEPGSLFFTYCQVPVVYKIASEHTISVLHRDGTSLMLSSHQIDSITSDKIFERTGTVVQVTVCVDKKILR